MSVWNNNKSKIFSYFAMIYFSSHLFRMVALRWFILSSTYLWHDWQHVMITSLRNCPNVGITTETLYWLSHSNTFRFYSLAEPTTSPSNIANSIQSVFYVINDDLFLPLALAKTIRKTGWIMIMSIKLYWLPVEPQMRRHSRRTELMKGSIHACICVCLYSSAPDWVWWAHWWTNNGLNVVLSLRDNHELIWK